MTEQDAAMALFRWGQRGLGKQRQRQYIVAHLSGRVTVTLRFGERYVFTVTRETFAEAVRMALAGADREDQEGVS